MFLPSDPVIPLLGSSPEGDRPNNRFMHQDVPASSVVRARSSTVLQAQAKPGRSLSSGEVKRTCAPELEVDGGGSALC